MNTYTVTDFGAKGNSSKIQTAAFQKCIDTCYQNGGGRIEVPAGVYNIGSIRLYSNMTLHLLAGTVLKGSKNKTDYADFHVPSTIQYVHNAYYIQAWNLPVYYFHAMITAFKATNIAIVGEAGSVIDGNNVFDAHGEEKFRGPMGIVMSQVDGVKLSGYSFHNSSNWSHCLDGCTNLEIDSVKIYGGHDGFNLHHSKNSVIQNCFLQTGDDCIAGYDIAELNVKNCYFNTACNGVRVGGQDIHFQNCLFTGPGKYPHLSENTYYTHAIFKYYSIDAKADKQQHPGKNIVFEDCLFENATRLLDYEFGNEAVMQNNQPLKDLAFKNCIVKNMKKISTFQSRGEQAVLKFDNVIINSEQKEFLQVDKTVVLRLKHTYFQNPATIQNIGALQVKAMTDFSINK